MVTIIPSGLYLYEFILLIFGGVLFVALIILLFTNKVPKKQLLPLFGVVILMVGYPSVKKIQVDGVTADLDQAGSSAQVQNDLQQIGDRPITNSGGLLALAKGKAVLGDTSAALTLADSSIAVDTTNANAHTYHEDLSLKLMSSIENANRILASNPQDKGAKKTLNRSLPIATIHADHLEQLKVLEQGYALLGNPKTLSFAPHITAAKLK